MPFGAAIAAAGSLIGGAASASGARSAARRAARASRRTDQSANLGFGLTQSAAGGQITQDQNQFTDLSRLFGGQAAQQLQQAQNPLFNLQQTGFDPAAIGQQQQLVGNQFGNVAQAINTQGQNQFDPNAFAATQFDRLQSLASRGEEIGANRVANNLFARGRLGGADTATGGAFEGLARAQGDARTQRALTATNMANSEAQRLFQQGQTGIQNQFGLLGQLQGQQQSTVGNFLQLQGFNQAAQQQNLQNAMGFGGAAGTVLNPNFQTLQATLNAQSADQSARAGVASTQGRILAEGASAMGAGIGNAFTTVGNAVTAARK